MASMAFSDTSNKNGVIQQCEDLTGLGDGAISGDTATLLKKFTALVNRAYDLVVTMILESEDDWDFDDIGTTDGSTYTYTTYPTGTIALTTNRDVTMPKAMKILKMKRVDITYDGSTYYKAEPFDENETGLGLGNDTNTDGRYSKTEPKVDLRGNAAFVYPRASQADVDAGAKIRFTFVREVSPFVSTDTTKTLGFDSPFHPLVAIRASLEWCLSNDLSRAKGLSELATDYEQRLRTYYGSRNLDRNTVLKPAYVNME